MSIEIFVLSDRRLGSMADWQQAIDQEGFGLRLSAERAFDALRGHLPAHLGGQHAGFECEHFDAGEFIDDMPDAEFGRRWKHVLAFRWRGDMFAELGGYSAAAAYARATNGVLFDGESGEVLSPDQAVKGARDMEKSLREHGDIAWRGIVAPGHPRPDEPDPRA
jgi:hypothetical protein